MLTLAAAVSFGGEPLTGTSSMPAHAQAQRITLVVPATVNARPASSTRLPIEVNPPDAAAKNSFIRIRGLPFAAALSEGHAVAPGAWAVPLNALPRLNIVLPVGIQGSSDVSISLVSVEGTVLAEAKTVLKVEAGSSVSRTEPTTKEPVAKQPTPKEVVVPPLPPEARERAIGLHAKGVEQLERGNVYAARKFFERAAEIGLAQSAVALAATYDPNELAKLSVVGLQSDPALAMKWYEKARELGAPEAPDRIKRLGAVR